MFEVVINSNSENSAKKKNRKKYVGSVWNVHNYLCKYRNHWSLGRVILFHSRSLAVRLVLSSLNWKRTFFSAANWFRGAKQQTETSAPAYRILYIFNSMKTFHFHIVNICMNKTRNNLCVYIIFFRLLIKVKINRRYRHCRGRDNFIFFCLYSFPSWNQWIFVAHFYMYSFILINNSFLFAITSRKFVHSTRTVNLH